MIHADLGVSPAANPLSWVASALCAQTDPEVFYPDQGSSNKAAKAVCRRCTVWAECLADALAGPNDDTWGVRGGLSARERQRLRAS